jgi:subtilisin family serine protease
MAETRPAWTVALGPDTPRIASSALLASVTWVSALGDGTGAGVRVGIVDSGIDNGHPEVGGAVRGWAEPIVDEAGSTTYKTDPHEDLFGHGTACAGIIHGIAPLAELYSIRVLGPALSGKGNVFAAGLRWAIEHDMHVVNLSLGTTKKDYFSLFHELVDAAYFKGVVLVTAANNMPVVSFPSLYSAVISVACCDGLRLDDPTDFYCNPAPPVEFGAPGIDLKVAWAGGDYLTATGNSFAAPHITGLVARLRGKHPGLTPFEVKTVLRAVARNVAPDPPAGGKAAGESPGPEGAPGGAAAPMSSPPTGEAPSAEDSPRR